MMRKAMFEIPFWTANLNNVLPFHSEMVREVERSIDSTPAEQRSKVLAHQTSSDPFLLPSPGWRSLDAHCVNAFRELAKQNFQRWREGEFHLRRWAIRYGRLHDDEKQKLALDGTHNHIPALFSAIYYLSVPSELSGRPEGGTVFVNPIANLMDFMSPRTTTIAAYEGLFIVFPSFIDHAPVPIAWDAIGKARIVVSWDVFFVSGRAGTAKQAPIPVRRGE